MVNRSKFFLSADELITDGPFSNSQNCQYAQNSPTTSQTIPLPPNPKSNVARQKFEPPPFSVEQLVSEQNQQLIGPDFELHQNVRVSVRGGKNDNGNQINLISSFEEANLSRQILQNLAKIRFFHPTAVQCRVIPMIFCTNEDLVCLASTGTGKTGAFLIPLLAIFHQTVGSIKPTSANRRSPKAIIIAHTKELVLQIDKTARIIADGTGIGIVLMMGELRYGRIHQQIVQEGCDVLIATPGRLTECIRKEWVDLDCLQFLVVDEMDKFFSDLVFVQVFRELNAKRAKIKNASAWPCRTLLFSATSYSVDDFLPFLRPNFFQVVAGDVNQSVSHVRQRVIPTNIFTKKRALERILLRDGTRGNCKKTLIFVNECRRCDRLAIMLSFYHYKAISINGHRTLEQRTNALAQFNDGKFDILVGTDVIARGMNIPNLSRVILYEMPPVNRYEQFVHRVGRVGRMGTAGEAFVFFDPEDRNDVQMAEFLRNQLVLAKQKTPQWLHEMVETEQKWWERGALVSFTKCA